MKCDFCANWQQQELQLQLQLHGVCSTSMTQQGVGLTVAPVDGSSVVRQSLNATRQKSYFETGCVVTMEVGMTMEAGGWSWSYACVFKLL